MLMNSENINIKKFDQLPLCPELLQACQNLDYHKPTKIQAQSLPYTLEGRDVIALAETGSGKTLAFALPMLQSLLNNPRPFFGIVLAPTRELVVQIAEHYKAIGANIGLKVVIIIGSMDLKAQVKLLNSNPHIIVGTPGKVLYHMENTKSFNYSNNKYLVMDEADKLLGDDFIGQLDKIINALPPKRTTLLFSATMTQKVVKLERAALTNPVKISVNNKYQTVQNLKQQYIFFPAKMKETYLAYIMQQKIGNDIIVFTLTCLTAMKICLLLRKIGYKAVTVNGQMSQNKRLGSLARFKQKDANILVATDVASRGLDIPSVDLVINYDLPMGPKDYVHRVGRTARAGKAGRAISFVTQYDIQEIQKIQFLIGQKLEQYQSTNEDMESVVISMQQMVHEKTRIANEELKLKMDKKKVSQEQLQEKFHKYEVLDLKYSNVF